MLLSILIAVAVFWASISVGIWFGRRHATTTPPVNSPPASPAPAAPATSASADLLQPGDRIELRLTDPSRSGVASAQPLTVEPDGTITLPLSGRIKAQYLTPAQLERAVQQTYKDRNLLGQIQIVRLPGTTTAPAAR
jgi:protein involved in polysaccharide export with SLBB domain